MLRRKNLGNTWASHEAVFKHILITKTGF